MWENPLALPQQLNRNGIEEAPSQFPNGGGKQRRAAVVKKQFFSLLADGLQSPTVPSTRRHPPWIQQTFLLIMPSLFCTWKGSVLVFVHVTRWFWRSRGSWSLHSLPHYLLGSKATEWALKWEEAGRSSGNPEEEESGKDLGTVEQMLLWWWLLPWLAGPTHLRIKFWRRRGISETRDQKNIRGALQPDNNNKKKDFSLCFRLF